LCCIPLGPGDTIGAPRVLYRSDREMWDPILSTEGTVVVVPSTERAGRWQPSLLAFDTATGTRLAELWDGPWIGRRSESL